MPDQVQVSNNKMAVANLPSSHVAGQSVYLKLTLVPYGKPVVTDINPIARLNFGVQIYNYDINRINDIYLMKVFTARPFSWIYDRIIYFYVLFFLTITCRSQVQSSCCWIFIYLLIYIFLLIGPIISAITMAISGLFFVYYCIGVVVYFINKKRLNGHQYTQNMVYYTNAPQFEGSNQFYELQAQYVRDYYYSNSKQQFYLTMAQSGRTDFMAYRDWFVTNNFEYIVSLKEVVFHIAFIVISILGLVVSVALFPTIYKRK